MRGLAHLFRMHISIDVGLARVSEPDCEDRGIIATSPWNSEISAKVPENHK